VGAASFSLLQRKKQEVELEFHQLELRYERLKVVRPEPERRLLASLAEVGQQVPVMVVKGVGESSFVVIDGYKRLRALRRLGRLSRQESPKVEGGRSTKQDVVGSNPTGRTTSLSF
jgi:hypothetical protein